MPSPSSADGGLGYITSTQAYYAIASDGEFRTGTFLPSDKTLEISTEVAFSKTIGSNGTIGSLRLIRPASSYEYSRISAFNIRTPSTGYETTTFCAVGVPTRVNDIPTSATVSFTQFAIAGVAYDRSGGSIVAYTLSAAVSMGVDVRNGVFQSTVALVGTSANGATLNLGSYNLVGTINQTDGTFFAGQDVANSTGFRINGQFFGPEGKEFGYSFELSRYNSNNSNFNRVIKGAIIGGR